MRVQEQTTLAKAASASGPALHTGAETRIVLRPAPADTGVVFRRMDMRGENGRPRPPQETSIPASPASVIDTRLGVRLGNAAGATVMTVEHLMAAFALAGVDNALVEAYGPEIPAFDGSAAPILRLIEQTGLRRLGAPRQILEARAPIRVEDGPRFIELTPGPNRRLDVTIDFPDPAIGRRSVALDLDEPAGRARLAAARTFCRLQDVEAMRAAGLALGGALSNAIVVDGPRILNPEGLRDPDEFALHKALDLLGDLYLAGAPICGHIRAMRPGHDLNARFARRLIEDLAATERRVIPLQGEAERLSA